MTTNKPLTLRRNFSWTFVGNTVYAACQWGILVVIAKLGSPEMVGQFTLGLAITAPVFMLTNLQLRSIQATDAKQQYCFSTYFELRLISTCFALIVIALITWVSGYSGSTSLVILMFGVAKAFESISDVFYGLLQQSERMDLIATAMMIKGPLSLLLLGIGIYLSGNALWGVVGLTIAWAIVLLGWDIRNAGLMLKTASYSKPQNKKLGIYILAQLKAHWPWKKLKRLVWLALPLGLVMMLISLNTNIPRYFVEKYLGERELGIFAALAYLMTIGNMIVNALGESASPKLAKYYAAKQKTAFRQLLFKLVGLAALLGGIAVILAVVAGERILIIFYQPEYADHKDLFVWLIVSAAIGFISYFLGYAMTAARYFRIQTLLFFTVAVTSTITCFWLIPTLGLKGAALALLIGAILRMIFSLGVIIHALRKI
ncbi:lipopolysaccharide biosynthesis protein [Acaryochloris marina NIES-2412]|uniref:lipopolysaccharide biosynthesis protein n=1 Tax=Acaryochloris marina TaxID=155978 RepID=UPI0040587A99